MLATEVYLPSGGPVGSDPTDAVCAHGAGLGGLLGPVSWGLLQPSWGAQLPAAISLLIQPLQVLDCHSHSGLSSGALGAWLISERGRKTSCLSLKCLPF